MIALVLIYLCSVALATCPAPDPNAAGLCSENCQADTDCKVGYECCSNGCGHDCICTAGVADCLVDPCDGASCNGYPDAVCTADYCGGCNTNWVDAAGNSITCQESLCPKPGDFGLCIESCSASTDCHDGFECCSNGCGHECICVVGQVECLADPCTVTSCLAHPDATCESNYCGGCNAIYKVDGVEVECSGCPAPDADQVGPCIEMCLDSSECGDGYECCSNGCGHSCLCTAGQVDCLVDPCTVTTCDAFPDAVCTADYCGSCNTVFTVDGKTVDCSATLSNCPKLDPGTVGPCIAACTDSTDCRDGYECCSNGCGVTCVCTAGQADCFADPCTVTTCDAFPDALCTSDYCGGCTAVFTVDGEEVECSGEPASGCPKLAEGTAGPCIELCGDSCGDGYECCSNGCGHSCVCTAGVVQCFADPCSVNTCAAHPEATCESDYCGGCNSIFKVDGVVVSCDPPSNCPKLDPTEGVGACVEACTDTTDCGPGYECCFNGCGHACVCTTGGAKCIVDPCQNAACEAHPDAICTADYCGGCDIVVWTTPEGDVVSCDVPTSNCPVPEEGSFGSCLEACSSSDECRKGYECCSNGCGHQCTCTSILKALCIRDPCEAATCRGHSDAVCTPDYCGGCNLIWTDADGRDVVCEESACPPVPDDQAGDCIQECSDSTTCRPGYECCSNGCGSSCICTSTFGLTARCAANPCVGAKCPGNPDATCEPDYCIGCNNVVWSLGGLEVSCEEESKSCDLCPGPNADTCDEGYTCCGCGFGKGTCKPTGDASCYPPCAAPPPGASCENPNGCPDDYYYDADKSECLGCPTLPNCAKSTCHEFNSVVCASCNPGYILDSDGLCSLPPQKCSVCPQEKPNEAQEAPCPDGTSCCSCGKFEGACAASGQCVDASGNLCSPPPCPDPPQVCDMCPDAFSTPCPTGFTCCGCGTGKGSCVEGDCLLKCATLPCPDQPPITCDACLAKKADVCGKTGCCSSCGRRGTCSDICPTIACAIAIACDDEEPENTSENWDLYHRLNISCDDSRISTVVDAIKGKVRDAVGLWDGSIGVANKDCQGNVKRQDASTLTVNIELDGDSASSAMRAVQHYFEFNPVLGTSDASIEATYSSEPSNNPQPYIYASSGSELSDGAIAGIVIGSVVGALIVLAAIAIFVFTKTPGIDQA